MFEHEKHTDFTNKGINWLQNCIKYIIGSYSCLTVGLFHFIVVLPPIHLTTLPLVLTDRCSFNYHELYELNQAQSNIVKFSMVFNCSTSFVIV